jgi:23S rRNA (adenine2503-C2)-methyltransferase
MLPVLPNTKNPCKPRVYELSKEALAEWCAGQGVKPFRAEQIRRWLFGKRISQFAEMHDLPLNLRNALEAEFSLFPAEVTGHQVAKDKTEKLLLKLDDGELIECVMMREDDRRTICISTQVGCAMGCVFCASGMLGLKRNLTTGEILEQILRLDRLLPLEERITNVVVMGIGEPLANLKSLLPALESLNASGGMGIGARRVTISTVGLPEKIRELGRYGKPYNLAVSLHAPNEELRTKLVPVNNKIGIESVLDAADEYFTQTGRRVTYEYVLLGGVNDEVEHAKQLIELLKPRVAHVNLIPMNDVQELPFAEPTQPRTQRFMQMLESAGIPATVRKRKGADIDAACGQLRLHAERLKEAAVT